MKTIYTVLITVTVYAVIMYIALLNDEAREKEKTAKKYKTVIISLPEEIDQAQQGDLLTVERISNDTIYLGYEKR